MSMVKRSTLKNFKKKYGTQSTSESFFSNIVVQAIVLKVLEKFCKLLGKTPVLEFLFKETPPPMFS